MTQEQAIAYVKLHAQTAAFPCIEDSDVSAIVERHKRAVVWEANKAYKISDRVQPTTPNGHFYECVRAGTSQPTEPRWSLRAEGTNLDDFLTGIVWQECAIDVDGDLYNLRNAIHECWTLKAAMSAKEFDVSIENQKWNRSQIHDHCVSMAQKFYPID